MRWMTCAVVLVGCYSNPRTHTQRSPTDYEAMRDVEYYRDTTPDRGAAVMQGVGNALSGFGSGLSQTRGNSAPQQARPQPGWCAYDYRGEPGPCYRSREECYRMGSIVSGFKDCFPR